MRPPKSPSKLLEGFAKNGFNTLEKFVPNSKIPISKRLLSENKVEEMQLRQII